MLRLLVNKKRGSLTNMERVRSELKMTSVNQLSCYHTAIEMFNVINNNSSAALLEEMIQVLDIDDMDIDTSADLINEAIILSFEKNCRLKPVILKRDPPWWNKDLQAMKLNVRRLINKTKKKEH